jgi:hypothetical protein
MNNRAVLIHEKHGEIEEIDLDISPMKNQIFKLLRGRQTFIGQWPDIDVVIMKAEGGVSKNENTLPRPFSNEEVFGKILLVRMDANSDPQDFTKVEYESFCGRNKRVAV